MAGRRPVVLCILDGWGHAAPGPANAVTLAETPHFDRIWRDCPTTTLAAHGPDVGLPEGQMGNSEVGHMNIGAGRVVWMDLPRIDRAIATGALAANPRLDTFIRRIRETGGRVHLAGLASPGGVHAHQDHMAALARILAGAGLEVAVHAFTDGRDVPPQSAAEQIAALEAALPEGAAIATLTGRFHAMDRDNRWDRVRAAHDAIVFARGAAHPSAAAAIAAAYASGITDEFLDPAIIGAYAGLAARDGLVFANFRTDRAREILTALVDPGFDRFPTGPRPAAALGMVSYSDALDPLMPALFPPEAIVNTLGQVVAAAGLRQFRLAETEKYPHVTFFLNGGIETPAPGERRLMAPSPTVRTYDLAPEMAAAAVGDALVAAIEGGEDALIVVNFANPDMVGHTGVLAAAIRACAAVDRQLGRALAALEAVGGAMIVTADHGNADMMVDPVTGAPHTAHTLSPVPVVLVGGPAGAALRPGGRLADLAPTVLRLMGLDQPAEMTGRSLLLP